MRLNGASSRLQIYDSRERAVVSAADGFLRAGAALVRGFRPRRRPGSPARILLLRLERIGDLRDGASGDRRRPRPRARCGHRPRRRQLESRAGRRDCRGVVGQGSRCAMARARGRRTGRHFAAQGGARMARGTITISRSISNRISARTCCSPRLVPRGRRDFRAVAAVHSSTRAIPYDPNAHTTDNARRLVAAALGGGATAGASGNTAHPEILRGGCGETPRRPFRTSRRRARERRTGDQAVASRAVRRGRAAPRHAAGATIVLTGTAGDREARRSGRVGAAAGTCHRCRDRFGTARRRRDPPPSRSVCHRRHRPHAPGGCGGDANRGGVRPLAAGALRAARAPRSGCPGRSSVQPVQPHPPSTRALCRPHARLP